MTSGRRWWLSVGAGFVGSLALAASLGAQARVSVVESDGFDIVFPGDLYTFLVPHVGGSVENSLQFHRELYSWTPSDKPTIFLNDFSDFGFGAANTVPTNFIQLGVAPFSYTYETIPAIERMFWLANHEMAHLATMDQATRRDLAWRAFFGGKVSPNADDPLSIFYNFLTNPRWNAPRWYHEGIAVFLETWMSGGLGRAMGAYDEMVFRAMVLDDALFYDVVGLESEGTTVDFQTGANAYLYGTRFMSYLVYAHGADKLVEWTARKEGSKAYFAAQFEAVYGMPLEHAWREWIAFEHRWQEANLEAIRANPITTFRAIASTPLGSVSRPFFDPERGLVYVAIRYPGQVAHLAAIDVASGELHKLLDLKGPATYYVTSVAYDPDRRVIFFTSDNYDWRDLWRLDLSTGETERLADDFRMGDLAFNRADRSLWGIQHRDGSSILVRVPEPYREWQKIHTFPYGSDLYDIDISPDGELLTGGLAEVDGSQSLVMLRMDDLERGIVQPEKLFDFAESLASNFSFSADGSQLYGSSYYSGVSNIYRYDLAKREIFVLSNAETGLFRPLQLDEDSLLAFRYTGRGFVPVMIADQDLDTVGAIRFLGTAISTGQPVVKEWAVGSPREAGYEPGEVKEYHAFRRMDVDSFYPVVEGYKSSTAAGVRLNLSDALGQSRLAIAASYSPDNELDNDEKVHLDLELDYWKWNLRATWNRADFYDLFGPTKTSRRGYSLGCQWDDVVIYDDPRFVRFSAGGEYWGDIDNLPRYQDVPVDVDWLASAWAELGYEFVQRSLGAVDDEKGRTAKLGVAADYVDGDLVPRVRATFDQGWALPLNHSSLWFRSAAGYAFGDLDDPFSNFFFGGFGNNYVDHRSIKRYRDSSSFPGLEISEVPGRSFAKGMLEWNLPPLRFRKVGATWLYLNWARPAVFLGVLTSNPEKSSAERTLGTVGAQVDLKMVLFSNLPMTLSIGYGVAFENGRESDEIMVSLKIL